MNIYVDDKLKAEYDDAVAKLKADKYEDKIPPSEFKFICAFIVVFVIACGEGREIINPITNPITIPIAPTHTKITHRQQLFSFFI